MKKEYIVFSIILVLVAGASFYGGIKYQESKVGNRFAQMQGQMPQGQRQGIGTSNTNRQKGGLIGGEVLSVDDKSMVLKDRSGGSKIIFFSGATQYLKSDSGTISDVTTGSNITVIGDQNTDGSVTAKTIQIVPQVQGGIPTNTQQKPVK